MSQDPFQITVVEAAELRAFQEGSCEPLGELYAAPYPSQHRGYAVDSFGSDVGSSVSNWLKSSGFVAGWASIVVCVTPALPEGEVRLVHRHVYPATGAVDLDVAVGLSRERWAGSSFLECRLLLADAVLEAVRVHAPAEGWGPDVTSSVARAFREDPRAYAKNGASVGRVAVPQPLLDRLELDAWNVLTDARRREASAALDAALRAGGRTLRSLGIRAFGPEHEPQAVAQWLDEATGSMLSLVPGGLFRPGYAAPLEAAYEAAYRQLSSLHLQWDEDEPQDPPRFDPALPERWRAKQEVRVAPFLIACAPLTREIGKSDRMIHDPANRVYGDATSPWLPLYTAWHETGAILRRYDWSLPTSAELEWAVRGGRDGLFHWGDTPHRALLAFHSEAEIPAEDGAAAFEELLHQSFEPEHARHWPWTNRFGLDAPLAHRTWCAPNTEDECTPLITRGGAAARFPWQYCGEWQTLLTAADERSRLDERFEAQAAIRGVIRLVGAVF